MFDPSPIHIILLLAVVLLIFGTKKLPEVGRSLGRGIREFKGSVTGDEAPAAAPPAPSPEQIVAAHQAVPAATPEIAQAEVAAAPAREHHTVA